MNYYVVVEGEMGAKKIYEHWIPYVNATLKKVDDLERLKNDNFIVFHAFGNPFYFNVIENAIQDVNDNPGIDKLVIAVDSEELSYQEKLLELNNFLSARDCRAGISLIIQHFNFEAWALGNSKLIRRAPHLERLRKYKKFYDVRIRDPEGLPAFPEEGLKRARFAKKYLRLAFNERHRNLTYKENRPETIAHPKFFDQLKRRLQEKNHIVSFQDFFTAFV